MARNAITDALDPTGTPQTEPIPGRENDMGENHAGGYAFKLDNFARLDRFLVLGTDGGTYYQDQRKLTTENMAVVAACVAEDGHRTVRRIVEVSAGGLAPRNTQTVYALAVACSADDPEVRAMAVDAIKFVCRTGTHLFQFVNFVQALKAGGQGRGWGRGLRRGVSNALLGKTPDLLAYHAVKYRQREGVTYRDVLRLAHPTSSEPGYDDVFRFMTEKPATRSPHEPDILQAFRVAQAPETSASTIVQLITDTGLPWEAIPDAHMANTDVQMALLRKMPVTATVRQLSRYARSGLLTPLGTAEKIIVDRLTDPAAIQRSKAHPLLFLDAMLVHASGGDVGRSRGAGYKPNKLVLDALDVAFRFAFGNVVPADKRTFLALDVSGSMDWETCTGSVAMTPLMGSAAMAVITAASEPRTHIAGFSIGMVDIDISGRSTIRQAVTATERVRVGGTDCAQPMIHARETGMEVDTFVVYTDNETWAGRQGHPSQALQAYRQSSGIDARLVVVGMTSTGFTIADPADPGMLDAVGFSTETPAIISGFSRRDF